MAEKDRQRGQSDASKGKPKESQSWMDHIGEALGGKSQRRRDYERGHDQQSGGKKK